MYIQPKIVHLQYLAKVNESINVETIYVNFLALVT